MTAAGPEQLHDLVRAVDAPDVVLALSRDGRRTVVTGGGAHRPASRREELRYEIGSASKTFTALLLADLAHRRAVHPGTPAVSCLPVTAPADAHRDAVSLFHLMTHTSGLPRLPRDMYRHSLRHWRTNPYIHYPQPLLLDAFARSRPRSRPGTRWHYSNFAVALLGPALAHATATPFEELMVAHVLAPLRLSGTALAPGGLLLDATGHDAAGRTPLPPFDAGAFAAAGAVRATPGDLLGYLEAHLRPERQPALREALLAVRQPLLRRGSGRQEAHTLGWFCHRTDSGPLLFHGGATMGQEVFLGYKPDTGTALAAIATRRYRRVSTLQPTAYELLRSL
ncbi:serine hydrolase domain-containing protein [Streptomyces sp. NPDC088746]|uniref:serine hydrolase domain-containing protein n=1 Tax=Streptomyces sp. NPDC088746 TaxID=3365885 RepID=UPI0037F9D50A